MLHDLFFKKGKKNVLNNFDVGMRPNSIYHQEAVFNNPLNSISKSVHHFVFLITHIAEASSVICQFCFSDFMHHLLICDCVRVISNKKKLESCIIQQHSIKLQVEHACFYAVCLKQSHLIVLKNIGLLHVFFNNNL